MSEEIGHLSTLSRSKPKFKLFERVQVLYYNAYNEQDCFTQGIVTGIEFCPALTEELGWWYKLVLFEFPVEEESFDHSEMDLLYINELEIFEKNIRRIKNFLSKVDVDKILDDLLLSRIEAIAGAESYRKIQ
jgi:hypothetical protein